jgi:hypothetical protein
VSSETHFGDAVSLTRLCQNGHERPMWRRVCLLCSRERWNRIETLKRQGWWR